MAGRVAEGEEEEGGNVYDLKELKAAANKACEMAIKDRSLIDGAVNWADLSCIMAEHAQDQDGNETHRVYIEEASPDASDLRRYIADKLSMMGYDNIEVITEW